MFLLFTVHSHIIVLLMSDMKVLLLLLVHKTRISVKGHFAVLTPVLHKHSNENLSLILPS